MTPRAKAVLWRALPPLLSVLLYLPTLRYGFVYDDVPLVVKNEAASSLANAGLFFTRDVDAAWRGADATQSNYYRPLFLLAVAAWRTVAGTGPAAWHALVVALFGLVAFLAAALLRAWGFSPAAAAAGAVAFALHPVHVDSVAWVSGLQDVLLGLFGLLAALCWKRWDDTGRRAHLACFALATALALLSKEAAAAILLLAGAALLVPAPREARVRRLAAFGAALVLTAAWLAARVAVLGALARPFPSAPRLPLALASVPVATAAYAKMLLAPFGLALLSPERPVPSFTAPRALLGLAVTAFVAAALVFLVRKRPAALAPALWLAAWTAPCLAIWAVNPEWMVMDRYLFLPALALPWGVLAWGSRKAVSALGALAVLYGALSLGAMPALRDEEAFWTRMREADPGSSVAWNETGRLLQAQEKRGEARAAFERAAALDPASLLPRLRLANLDLAEGHADAAALALKRLVEASPGYLPAWRNLPVALHRSGESGAALEAARAGSRLFPRDVELSLTLATLLREAGLRDEGIRALEAARAAHPGDSRLALRQAVLLAESGRIGPARELARAALAREEDPAARAALEELLRRLGPE